MVSAIANGINQFDRGRFGVSIRFQNTNRRSTCHHKASKSRQRNYLHLCAADRISRKHLHLFARKIEPSSHSKDDQSDLYIILKKRATENNELPSPTAILRASRAVFPWCCLRTMNAVVRQWAPSLRFDWMCPMDVDYSMDRFDDAWCVHLLDSSHSRVDESLHDPVRLTLILPIENLGSREARID